MSRPSDQESDRPPSAKVLGRLKAHAPRQSRYELRGEIARGGMGAILEIWDEDLRRTLAMKVVLGEHDTDGVSDTPSVDAKQLDRFLEEAQITAQLDHPGIVPVHELGIDEHGQAYFTMRLVQGRDLEDVFELVRRGAEDWTQARAVGALLKACEALAFAHSKQVIHRDLKPANIMVGRFGEVYVMDWGLARVLGEEGEVEDEPRPGPPTKSAVRTDRRAASSADSPFLTLDGDILGTPAYMPPEQARGELAAMGPASDVYSLGSILYHLLAGHRPYEDGDQPTDAIAIWRRLKEGPPSSLDGRAQGAPQELVAICDKAMSREPAKRYADMGEMAADLQAYVEGRVVQAHRTGALIELRKWVSRNRALALASAAALIFAIAGLSVVTYVQAKAGKKLGEQYALLEVARASAVESGARAVESSERATAALGDALITQSRFLADLAEQKLAEGDAVTAVRLALEALPQRIDAPDRPYVREAELALQHALRPMREIATFASGGYGDLNKFSPDGRLFFTSSSGSVGRLMDLEGQVQAVLRGHSGALCAVEFSANGQCLITAAEDGEVRLWDLEGNGRTVIAALEGEEASGRRSTDRIDGLLLGPEAQRILVEERYGREARSFDLDGNLLLSATRVQAVSPEGRYALETPGELATLFEDGHASSAWNGNYWELAGLEPPGDERQPESWPAVLKDMYHPDRPGGVVAVLHGHSGPIRQASFSLDGQRILTLCESAEPGSFSVRIWDLAGRELARLPDLANSSGDAWHVGRQGAAWMCAEFAPDGRTLVTICDDGATLWSRGGKRLAELGPERPDSNRNVCFRADGRLLLTYDSHERKGTSQLWNAVTGQLIVELEGHGHSGSNGKRRVFSADGQRILTLSCDGSAWLWDEAGKALATLSIPVSTMSPGFAHDGEFSPDGRFLVLGTTANQDSNARLWSVDPRLTTMIGTEADLCSDAAFGAGGKVVFTPTFRIGAHEWDQGGEPVQARGGFSGGGVAAIDPAQQRRVVIREGRARLYDDAGTELATLGQHAGGDRTVSFGPEGAHILTTSSDGTARVWSREGAPLAVLDGHADALTVAEISAGGARILTMSKDGRVLLWNLESNEPSVLLDGGERVKLSQLSPDGSRALTVASRESPQLWDADGRAVGALEGHSGSVRQAVFSPDGGRLLTATSSRRDRPRLWNRAGELVRVLEEHSSKLTHVSFGAKGELLLTGSDDGSARLWDGQGRLVAELPGNGAAVELGAISPDGARVLTVSRDEGFECARLWSRAGLLIAVLKGGEPRVTRAAFGPDGARLFTAGVESVQLWDAEGRELVDVRDRGKILHSAFLPANGHLRVTTRAVSAREWGLDGVEINASRDNTHTVGYEVLADDQQSGLLRISLGRVLVFDPIGRRILTVQTPRRSDANLWSFDGRLLAVLPHDSDVTGARVSVTARRIVTSTSDGVVKLWDDEGAELAVLASDGKTALPQIDKEGRLLLASATRVDDAGRKRSIARLWDGKGRLLVEFGADDLFNASLAPGGETIVTTEAQGKIVRLWDLKGEELALLERTSRASNKTGRQQASTWFTKDETRLMTLTNQDISQDFHLCSAVRLMDLNGDLLTVLEIDYPPDLNKDHLWRIRHATLSAELSPDGDRILTCSWGGIARLWDLDGVQIATWNLQLGGRWAQGFSGWMRSARFSPDGRLVLSVGQGRARLDPVLESQELLDLARTMAPRRLTPEQRKSFFLGEDPLPATLDELFGEHRLVERVVAAIDADTDLSKGLQVELKREARLRTDVLVLDVESDPEAVSSRGHGRAFIHFENHGGAACRIEWVDADGELHDYGVVEAGQRRPFKTSAGHVWQLTDAESGRRARYRATRGGCIVDW